jgi:hypothetical protein
VVEHQRLVRPGVSGDQIQVTVVIEIRGSHLENAGLVPEDDGLRIKASLSVLKQDQEPVDAEHEICAVVAIAIRCDDRNAFV